MARPRILDYMQVFRFWLADVTLSPLPVFLPALGFSTISAPQMTLDTIDIKPGNWHFPKKFVVGAKVEPIRLERGVQMFDADFWRWTVASVAGEAKMLVPGAGVGVPTPPGLGLRKNLLLIQYTGVNAVAMASSSVEAPDFAVTTNMPGKAWMLYNCIPTKYKATSDMVASETGVSIQELEIQPEWFEEFSLGGL